MKNLLTKYVFHFFKHGFGIRSASSDTASCLAGARLWRVRASCAPRGRSSGSNTEAMLKKVKAVLGLIFICFSLGCASLDSFLASLDGEKDDSSLAKIKSAPRYSETQNLGVPTDRQYKRMTRNRLEEESDLGSGAGSTWVMEGQGAYLFAQNKMRKEGDLLNVRLDGPAMKQVETKVSVIKKLLKQLEEQQEQQQQKQLNNSLAQNADATRAPAAEVKKVEPPKVEKEKEDTESLSDVKNIPTRLIEKLADGNYRVKGQQPFMIGKREYKVIVTGLIRPEDFNDEGISSDKLLDPQYDVVSIRRNARNE